MSERLCVIGKKNVVRLGVGEAMEISGEDAGVAEANVRRHEYNRETIPEVSRERRTGIMNQRVKNRQVRRRRRTKTREDQHEAHSLIVLRRVTLLFSALLQTIGIKPGPRIETTLTTRGDPKATRQLELRVVDDLDDRRMHVTMSLLF